MLLEMAQMGYSSGLVTTMAGSCLLCLCTVARCVLCGRGYYCSFVPTRVPNYLRLLLPPCPSSKPPSTSRTRQQHQLVEGP